MIESAPEIFNIIILATIAGLLGSVLGGLVVVFVVGPSKKFIGLSFTFAASVLVTLVFMDFIPHAIGHGHYHTAIDPITGIMYQYWFQHGGAGIWLTLVGMGIGVGLISLLSLFDAHGHEHIHGVLPHSEHCSHSEMTPQERRRVASIAFPVAFAIILHDLPKGFAIGSAGTIMAALAIGMSCIPEGMTIAIPLKAGGVKRRRIIGICALAGIATVLGAVIGYLVGGINVYLSGVMFAIAAGCILGVVFTEIMPLAVEYTGRSRLKLPVMFVGALLVIAMNYFFHDLAH